jgi:hypothetical protein
MKARPMMRKRFILAAALCSAVFAVLPLRCSYTGGSEVGNPSQVAVVGAANYSGSGAPAAFAKVRLVSSHYLKDTTTGAPNPHGFRETVTKGNGSFIFEKVDTGDYCVEISDGKSQGVWLPCSAVGSDPFVSLSHVNLKPTASLTGTIDNLPSGQSGTVYVQVYGLDRVVQVNPATGAFTIPDVPEGDYTIRVVSSLPDNTPQEVIGVQVVSGTTTTVDPVILTAYGTWQHSARLTVSPGFSSGGGVQGIPLLVRLTKDNFHFEQALPDGSDLRFAKPDNSPLRYEIERWDATSGAAEVWVRLDTLFSNDTARSIFMYWGKPGVTSESNGAAVFDTTDAFTAVWHFAEIPGVAGSVRDQTKNHLDGVPAGMDAGALVDGIAGKGYSFDGIDDKIAVPSIATDFTKGITISGWMNYRKFTNWSRLIDLSEGGPRTNEIMFGAMGGSSWAEWNIWNADSGKGNPLDDSAYFALNTWVYMTATYDGAAMALYKNGSLVGTRKADYPLVNVSHTINYIASSSWSSDSLFCGQIDELEISRTARSPEWIRISYENQKAGSSVVRVVQ